jgi:hypothetical protein
MRINHRNILQFGSRLRTKFLLYFLFILMFHCHIDRKLEVNSSSVFTVKCETNQFRIANLCEDEEAYLKWAVQNDKYKSLKELTVPELGRLTKETLDVDKVSALFYLKSIQEEETKKLLDFLDKNETKSDYNYKSQNIILAVVPGMFYKDNPTVGADGRMIRDIALNMGLKEEIIPIDQTGTTSENSEFICNYLKNKIDAEKIILTSVSKGSSDLKIAIKKCGNEPYFKKVIGWYNIGGINRGSVLIDTIENNWQYRWEAKFYFWLKKYNYNGFLSLQKGRDIVLEEDLQIPTSLTVINVIAVPTFRQVTQRARPFYEYLIRFGPNDGMTLLADSYMEGAINIPSWRNDHYFQWPIPENRIKAYFSYLIEKKKK